METDPVTRTLIGGFAGFLFGALSVSLWNRIYLNDPDHRGLAYATGVLAEIALVTATIMLSSVTSENEFAANLHDGARAIGGMAVGFGALGLIRTAKKIAESRVD